MALGVERRVHRASNLRVRDELVASEAVLSESGPGMGAAGPVAYL